MESILGYGIDHVAWIDNETIMTAFVNGGEAGADVVSDKGNIVVSAELRPLE